MVNKDDVVLLAIQELSVERGIPPTYREIGVRIGMAHSAVHGIMRRLVDSGYVVEEPRSARTVRLTKGGRRRLTASVKHNGEAPDQPAQ